jgi:hypothetical protein
VKNVNWKNKNAVNKFKTTIGDRELDIDYLGGDTIPEFINVELETKEKYIFLLLYTSDKTMENEFNLEDAKSRNEVMLDQKERRLNGMPDNKVLDEAMNKNARANESSINSPKVDKEVFSNTISTPKKSEFAESKPNLNKEIQNKEFEEVKQNEKVKTPKLKKDKLPKQTNVKNKEDEEEPVEEKVTKHKVLLNNSYAIEIQNYLELQEDDDLVEILLIDPIELDNGFKKRKNQLIKMPVEIRYGRIFITLANQLSVYYEEKEGLPLSLTKNTVDARFIKK